MKKSVFIILFVLIVVALLYSPIKKSIAQSPSCFPSNALGFVSNNIDKVLLNYKYENVETTNWKGNAFGQFSVQELTVQGEPYEKILPTSLVSSQDNCNVYSFEFGRLGRELSYQIPLKTQTTSNGITYCIYNADGVVNKIMSLAGTPTSLEQICSDLRQGVESSGQNCPLEATCNIAINSGSAENYLFGVSSDGCGNYIVETINEGNPVSSSEISAKADEFISQCNARMKSGASAATITPGVTPGGGGTGGSGESSGGATQESGGWGCVGWGCVNQIIRGCEKKEEPICGDGKCEGDEDYTCWIDCDPLCSNAEEIKNKAKEAKINMIEDEECKALVRNLDIGCALEWEQLPDGCQICIISFEDGRRVSPPYERQINPFDSCGNLKSFKQIASENGLNVNEFSVVCQPYSRAIMPAEGIRNGYYQIIYLTRSPSCPGYLCWGICCRTDSDCPEGKRCQMLNTSVSEDIGICV